MTSMIERWKQDPGQFLPVSEHEDGAAPDHALVPGARNGTPEAPPDIDGDDQSAILTDILSGISPDQSWLTYTPEMLAYRAQLEGEIGGMRAEHADAIVDVPADIPSLDVSAERGVARATLPKRNENAVNALLRPQTGEGPDLGTGRSQVPAGTADAKPTGQPEVITFGPGKTQLGAPGDEVDEANKPVDWYVDIGFPPLEQKDVSTYMDAMVKLAMLLPQGVEGKKLVIGLALSVMGVNDVDQVMDLLVTELQKQEKEQKALMAGGGQGGFGAGRLPPGPQFLTPGGGGGFGGGGGGFGQPRGGGRFGEADELPLPEARMRRIIEAVSEAAAALEQVSDKGSNE
jgi:hypothetical protein